MLELAVASDDRALAIGFDRLPAAHPLAQRARQLPAEIAQACLKRHQVGLVAAGIGIVDDGERGTDQQRLRPARPAFVPDLFDGELRLPDVVAAHVAASSTTGLRSTPIFSTS